MRPTKLQALTWATVAAAVASALWLVAIETDPGATLRLTSLPTGSSSLMQARELAAAPAARRSGLQPKQPRRPAQR